MFSNNFDAVLEIHFTDIGENPYEKALFDNECAKIYI